MGLRRFTAQLLGTATSGDDNFAAVKMTIVLPILGIAFTAFCVWLTLRVVNKGERWAKWTLVSTMILVPTIYLGSFGPIMRHATSFWAYSWECDLAEEFYRPIFWVCGKTGTMPSLWKYLNLWGCGFETGGIGCIID